MKAALQILFCLSLTTVLKSQTSWTPQAQGLLPPKTMVFGISIVNKDVVWAVADSVFTDSIVPRNHLIKVLKTTNGGTTWRLYKVVEAVGRLSWDIQAIDSSVAWITGQDYNSGLGRELFKTTDGGTTWVSKFKGVEAGVWIRFFDDQNAIILNSSRFARTNDGGTVWSTGIISGFKINEGNLFSSSTNSCCVVGDTIWFGTSQSRIARSVNKGGSWELIDLQPLVSSGARTAFASIAFKDARNGIAIGWENIDSAKLFRTSKGGTTWSKIPNYDYYYGSNIEYIKGTQGSFIVTDPYGFTSFTTDFGQNWRFVDSLESNVIRFIDTKTGWVGNSVMGMRAPTTNVPTLYKWNGGNILSAIQTLDADAIAFKISPNPTSRFLAVEYAADFKPTSITIYNVSGKVVWRQKEAFTPSQVIDLQSFSDGIYFVQLQNREGAIAKKVVVQR